MKSELAIAELKKMTKDGLAPTPEDVIRLNAFGLKVDEAQGRRADDSARRLPRVAWLAGGVFFRQPSVGHEIWLASAMRFAADGDLETMLALNCFALSRPASELPDPCDPANVERAAADFAKRMSPYTKEILLAAVCYARFGIDPADGEEPPKREPDADGSDAPDPSPEDCVAVGSLVDGAAYLWGMSLADIQALTSDQLELAVRNAVVAHGLSVGKGGENAALGRFYAVRDEIANRLKKESDHGCK